MKSPARFLLSGASRVCAGLVLSYCATAPSVRAEEGRDSGVYIMPRITVTANRGETTAGHNATALTVVTAQRLRDLGVATISDAIRFVAGVDIAQSGPRGGQTSAFVRGANSNHTLVLLDGVAMNDPSSPNGACDLASLSVDDIERIEVLRGSQGLMYGSDAIGGVVNIISRPESSRAEFNAALGSHSLWRTAVNVSGATNAARYSVALSRFTSAGVSAVSRRVGGLEADGSRDFVARMKAGYRLNPALDVAWRGSLTHLTADLDKSWAGPTNSWDDRNYSLARRELSSALEMNLTPLSKGWRAKVVLGVARHQREAQDTPDVTFPDDRENSNFLGQQYTAQAQLNRLWSAHHASAIGADYQRDKMESKLDLVSAFGPYFSSFTPEAIDSRGVWAQHEMTPTTHLYFSAGARIDDHESFGSSISHRVASAVTPGGGILKLRGAVSSGYKAPTSYQLYDEFSGNKNLQPEQSRSVEVGGDLSVDRSRGLVSLTAFRTTVRDLIDVGSTWVFSNLERATMRGVEVSFIYNGRIVGFSSDFTRTLSQSDGADRRQLLRRPRNKGSALITVIPLRAVRTSVSLRYVGAREDVGGVTLADYTVVGCTATYQVVSGVSVEAGVGNIFNTGYEQIAPYNGDPRAITIGLRLSRL